MKLAAPVRHGRTPARLARPFRAGATSRARRDTRRRAGRTGGLGRSAQRINLLQLGNVDLIRAGLGPGRRESPGTDCAGQCPRQPVSRSSATIATTTSARASAAKRRASPRRLGATPRSLRTNLGAFLGASPALATHGLDEGVEIIAAIVIRDLVTGLDILDRPDL